MNTPIRDVTPDDAAGIVAVLNPIIAAGSFTTFTKPLSIEAGFNIVGTAVRQAKINGQYIDEIMIARLL